MADYLQVSTATETREQAQALAESIVRSRLAAGAQIIGPVSTAFWHLGEFGTGEEYRLLLTTTSARYAEFEEHLIEHHPWQNPEVIATPIVAGAPAYLEWIGKSTTD
ncbi:divalent-cation tolerance protein CutA [Streptomyces sp. MUM 16J]|uniref:divalent-cation tolerance protein CutA n=1 Tax=Streptomyces sp. MUM 16J TaxID=2791988 RepID=UPI001F046C70|nr:divalent-cation tolerance protein CutA [Streptomyces sp. MUM 16J]MCH0555826.1 divalent-cation tolerance protein CutA [Streptomyces sp. MUM 16J]